MSRSKSKLIGITLGDPSGIGPEVVVKALSSLSPGLRKDILLIGDARYFKKFSASVEGIEFEDLKNIPFRGVTLGKPSSHGARASLDYLDAGIKLLKRKKISGVVTAPVCKESISALGTPFHGHTEYLAEAFGIKDFGMMFVTDHLKTILVTRHIPLQSVSSALTRSKIYKTILILHQSLRTDFGLSDPCIGVCGLNPHTGEGGILGREEMIKIIPAIKEARRKRIKVFGPLAADTAFTPQQLKLYDALVAMYHDQGLIALKALCFDKVVNFTCGLPFIRTSPAHGTAFDIAGKNIADPSSMICAIKLAIRLVNSSIT